MTRRQTAPKPKAAPETDAERLERLAQPEPASLAPLTRPDVATPTDFTRFRGYFGGKPERWHV